MRWSRIINRVTSSRRGAALLCACALLAAFYLLVNSFVMEGYTRQFCQNTDGIITVLHSLIKQQQQQQQQHGSGSSLYNPVPISPDSDTKRLADSRLPSSSPISSSLNNINTVYYVWCGRRSFEFRHYLSVLSAIKYIQPTDIIFYYETFPVVDYWVYNTWFSELIEAYPFFQPIHLVELTGACGHDGKPIYSFIFDILSKSGGVYMSDNVVIATPFEQFHRYDIVTATRRYTTPDDFAFISAKYDFPCGNGAARQLLEVEPRNVKFLNVQCESQSDLKESVDNRNILCLYLDEALFPQSLWISNSSLAKLGRSLFYGTEEMPQLQRSEGSIPRLGHMVWIGGGKMSFIFYLGILSLLNVAKLDKVYIHGDKMPSGFYWDLLMRSEKRVLFNQRVPPRAIYGQGVYSKQHMSDIWRVDLILNYGGLYMDTDALFTRELDDQIMSYDAVGCYDWPDWNPPYPDTINFGVSLGKPGAKFWKLFLESMKTFNDMDFSYNGLRRPYQVFERHPDLLKIEPRLQVICFHQLCHPTWWKDYHLASVNHLTAGRSLDWRNDTYSFHWTFPTPSELKSHRNLLKSNSMFADIGKNILIKSNMLRHFEGLR